MHPLKKRQAKKLLGVCAGMAALVAFSGCDLQENADTDRGEQLFTQNCGSCHSLIAAGTNSDIGPDLDAAFKASRAVGMDQDTIEGVVESQIQNPRPANPEDTEVYMPANLVEGDDLRDVAAYIAGVAGVPGIEAPEFLAPEFFATNCGGCHTLGAAGTAGAIGPNLDEVLPGQSEAQVSESIANPEAQVTPGFPAGVMPAYADTLTPAQLRQLAAYLLQSAGN